MYEGGNTRVRLGEVETEIINMGKGLKKGCGLSQLLFALYIAGLGKKLESSGLGAKVGTVNIPALFFADDIVLIGSDTRELMKLLNMVREYAEERKLKVNDSKSRRAGQLQGPD